jgi:hypothetical protein
MQWIIHCRLVMTLFTCWSLVISWSLPGTCPSGHRVPHHCSSEFHANSYLVNQSSSINHQLSRYPSSTTRSSACHSPRHAIMRDPNWCNRTLVWESHTPPHWPASSHRSDEAALPAPAQSRHVHITYQSPISPLAIWPYVHQLIPSHIFVSGITKRHWIDTWASLAWQQQIYNLATMLKIVNFVFSQMLPVQMHRLFSEP